MKLVHPRIESHIEVTDEIVNVLVIENQKFFRSVIEEISNQIEGLSGRFTLSSDLRTLDIQKNFLLINEPIGYDINSRKVANRIQTLVKNIAVSEDYYIKSNELISKILEYGMKIINEINLPLTLTDEIDVASIIKLLNVQIDIESTDIVEKLENFIDILSELKICNTLLFVNLKTYLDEDEISLIYDYCSYKKMSLLLLENTKRSFHPKEKSIIIDSDLCEIF